MAKKEGVAIGAGEEASSFAVTKKNVLMAMKANVPVFIWGSPGQAKSSLGQLIANEEGYELIDLRLNLLNPVDLRGIPRLDDKEKITHWYPPAFLPRDEINGKKNEKKYILFLDELNVAPPQVQSAAYQLILDRKVGEYTCPSSMRILAAGNRATDRCNVFDMPAALRNRMSHLYMKVQSEEWLEWAFDHQINPRVVGYLKQLPSNLFKFENNPEAFPSPRSWEMVSKIADQIDKTSAGNPGKLISLENYASLIHGTVGREVGTTFMQHDRIASSLPDVMAILDKGEKPTPPADPGALYTLGTLLVYRALENLNDGAKGREISLKRFTNLVTYIMEKMPSEHQTAITKDFTSNGQVKDLAKLASSDPIWQRWASEVFSKVTKANQLRGRG